MRGLNKVTLIGNLGDAPVLQHLEGNVAVAKCSLATTEAYKNAEGQTKHQTEWHTVILWRGMAETACRYLKKGSLIYVEGKLKTRSYEDAHGGKRFVTEVLAESFIMLSRKTENESGDNGTS